MLVLLPVGCFTANSVSTPPPMIKQQERKQNTAARNARSTLNARGSPWYALELRCPWQGLGCLLGGLLRLVLRDTATRAADLQAPVLGLLDLLAGRLLLLLLGVPKKSGEGCTKVKIYILNKKKARNYPAFRSPCAAAVFHRRKKQEI